MGQPPLAFIIDYGWGLGFRRDAIHPALAAAAAHHEIESTIGADIQVGDIHRRPGAETLDLGLVTGPVALQEADPDDAQ